MSVIFAAAECTTWAEATETIAVMALFGLFLWLILR